MELLQLKRSLSGLAVLGGAAPLQRLLAEIAAIGGITGLWLGPEGADGALVNQITGQAGTVVGSPVYAPGGYTVSSGNYIDTGAPWNSLVTQNSAMLAVWTLTEGTNPSGLLFAAGATTVRATLRTSADLMGWRINASAGVFATAGMYDTYGLIAGQRVSSSAVEYYVNGVKFGDTVSSTSVAAPSGNLTLGAATSSDTRQIACVVVGAPLSGPNHARLNSAVRSYLAAHGVEMNTFPPSVGLSAAATIQTPDIAGASASGKGFTCTGLASLGGGQLLVGDDGRYGTQSDSYTSANWRPKLHVVGVDGSLVSSIDVYALDGSPTTLQGVAYDGAYYYAARTSRNRVIKINPAGALVAEMAVSQPNGLAYDSARDRLYVSASGEARVIRVLDMIGTQIGQLTLPGGAGSWEIDHLSYDSVEDVVLVTKGNNGTTGVVYAVNPDTAAAVSKCALTSSLAIEGVCRVGSDLYVADDEYFHNVGGFANVLHRYAL